MFNKKHLYCVMLNTDEGVLLEMFIRAKDKRQASNKFWQIMNKNNIILIGNYHGLCVEQV